MEIKTKKMINTIIFSIIGCIAFGCAIHEGIGYQINNEGSDIWYRHAPLDKIKAYREKLGIQFRDSGINNLSDQKYSQLEREMRKADNVISARENAIYEREHPNAQPVYHSNGYYLESDD